MTTRYLSFNPSVHDAVNLDECITEVRRCCCCCFLVFSCVFVYMIFFQS